MAVTFKDVVAAKKALGNFVHTTPVLTSSSVDSLTGLRVFFKAENLQTTGSFKARGALYAVGSSKICLSIIISVYIVNVILYDLYR